MTVDRLHEDMGEPEAAEQPPVAESAPEERAAILAAVPEVLITPSSAQPEQEVIALPEPDTAQAAECLVDPGAVPDPVIASDSEAEPAPAADAAPDIEPNPEVDPTPDIEPNSESEPTTEAAPNTEAELAATGEQEAAEASAQPTDPAAHESTEGAALEPIAFPEDARAVSIWPFVAYDGVWAAFAGFIVWQLLQVPSGSAVYESEVYPLTLFGGLVLTAAGPLLIVVSWLSEKGRSAFTSAHVFFASLMRGSVATLIGVALWWIALLVVDQIRLGRLF